MKELNTDGSQYKLGLSYSLYFRFVCLPTCSSSALTYESFDLVKFIRKSGSSVRLVSSSFACVRPLVLIYDFV